MKIINLDEFSDIILNRYDFFICSSSFEQRCLSVCTNINTNKIKKSFIIYNK
jgi:hypothetical protein